METERRLEKEYPWILWKVPVPMEILGHGIGKGYGCRYCIAMIGYSVPEKRLPGYHESLEETLEHIKQQHLPKEEEK
jgi:hypothetical protein